VSSLRFQDYQLTPEWHFSFWSSSLQDWPPSDSSPWELKCTVTLSHSYDWEETDWWLEAQHPAAYSLTTSKYSSSLTRSEPPSTYLYTPLITATKRSSETALLGPPSSQDDSLQVHFKTHSITTSHCLAKYAHLLPPSKSPNLHDEGLGVLLQVHSMVILMCTSNCTQAPSAISPDITCVGGW